VIIFYCLFKLVVYAV